MVDSVMKKVPPQQPIPQTGDGDIQRYMPSSATLSIVEETEPASWFKDGAAHIYPQNLFQPGCEAYIFFAVRDPIEQATKPLKRVGLYMPPSIKVNYGAEWNEIQMTVNQSLAGAKSLASYVTSGESSGEFFRMMEGVGTGAAELLLGREDLGQQLEVATKHTPNPHQALMFKGIQFREFQFDFQLMARTKKESEEIRRIIKIFKWGMHPGDNDGYYWTYPCTFDIYLLSPEHKYMFNISQSVLTKMDVDYGGSGAASFFRETGAPVDIRLTLNFKELSVLTKKLIEKDY